jgi:molecular chaperone GrpE
MGQPVRVPIRVKQADGGSNQQENERRRAVTEPEPAVTERELAATKSRERLRRSEQETKMGPAQSDQGKADSPEEDLEMWRDRALRLQAEIENFRKRQRRLAEERIEENRARLLRNFLMIADDLDRALKVEGDGDGVREGVGVTQRSLGQLLKQEGVELIEAEGETFDPTWHEAVGTVPHEEVDADPGTVVDVTQQGYRLNGRLLRPARVIVAR